LGLTSFYLPLYLLFSIIAFDDGFIHFISEKISNWKALSKEVFMGYADVDIVKPLDRLFENQIREFESGSDRVSDEELKKMMLELGDFEIGCRTGKRRNRE
jgi:hypothetical protein